MSAEPMELAVNWHEKNAAKVFPAWAQIKYDGVPITWIRTNGGVVPYTRQNEVCLSIPHITAFMEKMLVKDGDRITAECLVPGLSFKDSSGIIRRKVPDKDTANVVAIIFDGSIGASMKETYYTRMTAIKNSFDVVFNVWRQTCSKHPGVLVIKSVRIDSPDEVESTFKALNCLGKPIEGMMMHSLTKPLQPGKRCIGMARYKPQPTVDLEVVGFAEAVSEDGSPLGMIGRVNVVLHRKSIPEWIAVDKVLAADWEWLPDKQLWRGVIGIGPGKLTHAERTKWWNTYVKSGVPDQMFAEIKYMPDPEYLALRQPTVQRFRFDKIEGDVL